MLLENLLIKDYKRVMNAETDQFGRPLDTSDNINEKTDQSTEVNDALNTIKEEINSFPDQKFEPMVDLQDQVSDSKNIDSIEKPVTEESASTKDLAEDFTPSAPEETISEDFKSEMVLLIFWITLDATSLPKRSLFSNFISFFKG